MPLTARTNLPGHWWFIAFLFFPYGPIVCLWKSGACTGRRCLTSLISLSCISFLYIAALSKTNGNQLVQGWILLSLIMFHISTGYAIFSAGMRLHLWPRHGLKAWKVMGCVLMTATLLFLISLTARLYLTYADG